MKKFIFVLLVGIIFFIPKNITYGLPIFIKSETWNEKEVEKIFEKYYGDFEDYEKLDFVLSKYEKEDLIRIEVNNDWTSYWKLLKMKKNKTYDKKINIPRYKKKYNLVEYNNQVISKKKLKLGYIGTDKMELGIIITILSILTLVRLNGELDGVGMTVVLITLVIGLLLIYFGNKIDTDNEIDDKNEDKAIIEKIL